MKHIEIAVLSTPLAQEVWMKQGAMCLLENQPLVGSFGTCTEGRDDNTSLDWLGDKDLLDRVSPLSGR